MGNIYYKQENYLLAVKMYRMALDEIPNSHKETRYRIMRNIGNTLMRMGQYQVRFVTNILVLSSAHYNYLHENYMWESTIDKTCMIEAQDIR
jgi:intraflagellar transport protein 88